MRSAAAPCLSRFLPSAVTLLVIACSEATAPRVPTKLAFTVQPAVSVIGKTPMPAVKVAVQDATGVTITTATNDITLAIGTNPAGGSLAGTFTVAAVNGVATFTDLSIDGPGVGYTLSATSLNLTGATSTQFSVVSGLPAKLVFTVQPVSTTPGGTIPVAVTVQDVFGNRVPSANNSITITIGANPGSGVLFGTTSVAAVNGVATFSNLSITNPGTGYTLTATSPGLTPATSLPFILQVGPASKLAFTVHPATSSPGATIVPPVVVTIQDVSGNTVTAANHSITVAIGANPGSGTLSGTTTVAAANGVATFSNLSINNAGTVYTLTAAAANLIGVTSAPFSIRNPLVFATVSAGYFHACGVAAGAGYCWGDNSTGRLGDPTSPANNAPMPVSGGLTFASISAGRDHTCGLTPSGAAYCWGSNVSGELGTGIIQSNSSVPAAVFGGLTFAAVNAGYAHTCGVTTGGVGYCWGNNTFGELGVGTQIQHNVPTAVSGGLTFAKISQGRFFSCGMTTAGAAYCWGVNSDGELGDGTQLQRSSPVPVSGLLTFALVSAGGFHSCGLTTGGAAYCWGSGSSGALGNGLSAQSSVPVPVSGGLIFATLSAGNRHTCGVTNSGAAYCWGDNSNGNLGNGTNFPASVPVAVAGGLTFSSISAGRFHTCGVTTGGLAYCWGGLALGNGTPGSSLVPVPVR